MFVFVFVLFLKKLCFFERALFHHPSPTSFRRGKFSIFCVPLVVCSSFLFDKERGHMSDFCTQFDHNFQKKKIRNEAVRVVSTFFSFLFFFFFLSPFGC